MGVPAGLEPGSVGKAGCREDAETPPVPSLGFFGRGLWPSWLGQGLDLAAEDGSGANAGPLCPVLMWGMFGGQSVCPRSRTPSRQGTDWCLTGFRPAATGKHSGASRGGEHTGEEGGSDFCHDGQGEDAQVVFSLGPRDLGGSCGPPCHVSALAGASFPRQYKVSAATGLAADPHIPPGSPYPFQGP